VKREKRLTKREQKALKGPRPGAVQAQNHQHIHCVACGRHIDPVEFEAPARALMLRCRHGSTFPSCVEHRQETQDALDEHDRTGQNVKTAGAWH
jgi:hypothetical protein